MRNVADFLRKMREKTAPLTRCPECWSGDILTATHDKLFVCKTCGTEFNEPLTNDVRLSTTDSVQPGILKLVRGRRVDFEIRGMLIKVTLPDRTLGITFKHSKVTVPVPKNVLMARGRVVARNIKFKRETRATYCGIYEINGNSMKWCADGDAIVGIGDNFCKETGRKLSLARALAKMKLASKYRELVWDAYKNRAEPSKEVVH